MAASTILRLAASLTAVLLLAGCARTEQRPGAADDDAAVRQRLVDWYAVWSGGDEADYRTFVTDDYVLLENGELMDVEDDLKMMRSRPSGYARKDAFDFQSVRVHGDVAYATYFLESEIADDTRIQQRRWLESAVLRRLDGRWRVALLHSTRISGTDTPRSEASSHP